MNSTPATARGRGIKTPIKATSAIKVTDNTICRLSDVFKILADKSRLKILMALSQDGEPVGVARYIRLREDPATAEVAVTVVDPWQGRGAGSALLALLATRAREEGITTFRATCLAENRAMLDLLRALGPTSQETATRGVVEIAVDLPADIEPGNPLHKALQHAAAGAIKFRHPVHA